MQKIEDDPQHNFFIGLAYLNGIDVEVNHERAVEMISDAAKDGLTEAISKLADMYWVGDGVDRDYATSVEWQEKLTWKLSFRYRNDKSQANATAFMQALLKLADNCCTLGQMDKAWNVYKQLFDLAEAASKESATPENLLFLASAYERMGEWQMEVYKKPDDAICNYQESIKIREKIQVIRQADSGAIELAICYRWLGVYQVAGKKYDEALHSYEKSLEICRYLEEDKRSSAYSNLIAGILYGMGKIHSAKRSYQKAQELYDQSLCLYKSISEEARTLQSKRNVSICNSGIGDLHFFQHDCDVALEYYMKSLAVSHELVTKRGLPEDKRDLAYDYESIGMAYRRMGENKRATEYRMKAIKLRAVLAAESAHHETLQPFRMALIG